MHIGLTYDLQTDPTDERSFDSPALAGSLRIPPPEHSWGAPQAEFDSPTTIHALSRALEALGHRVVPLGSASDLLADQQRLHGIDLVFNIAEGTHGRCREAWVPMLLEQWSVPFVGSDATAQAIGLDKVMSKKIACASGVPTPQWRVAADLSVLGDVSPAIAPRTLCFAKRSSGDGTVKREHSGGRDVAPIGAGVQVPRAVPVGLHELTFPLIIKPRYEGSGCGIDPGAIVHDAVSLHTRVRWVLERFHQPCLIEEFIPFGELTVFLIGNHPPQALPAIQRPLDARSRLSCHVMHQSPATTWLCPVELTPDIDTRARRMAVTMFDAIGCRDMARVDLRVDERGELYFLEINPLPSFDPEGSVGLLAEYVGTTYSALIGRILDVALSRLHMTQSKISSGR